MPARSVDDGVSVRVVGVPVALRRRSAEHLADLVRELQLVNVDRRSGRPTDLPAVLLQIASELPKAYARLSVECAMHAGDDGADGGLDTRRGLHATESDVIDVALVLRPSLAPTARRLLELLEDAHELCRVGRHVLTAPAAADVVALRRWWLLEVAEQLEQGRAPRAFATSGAPVACDSA